MDGTAQKKRKRVSLLFLIITGVIIGLVIKNVKAGLLIGIALGFLIAGLASRK